MQQQELNKILTRLEKENSDPLKVLSSVEFEIFCEALALKWAKETITSYFEVERRVAEPIDILVREPRTPTSGLPNSLAIAGQSSRSESIHYIECKLYGRPLTLNVVGASYLHALKDRPTSLVIASNEQLTRGAQEFACWLFSEEMRNLTSFYTWNPLGGEVSSSPPKINQTNKNYKTHRPIVEIYDWKLVESGVFRDILVARKEQDNKKVHILGPNDKLRISLKLINPVKGRILKEVKLSFESNSKRKHTVSLSAKGKVDKVLLYEGEISLQHFPGGNIYKSPTIKIVSSSGTDRFVNINGFPNIKTDLKFLSLPDLRENQSENICKTWIGNPDHKILVIRGEGGIGKTYMCEKIASQLQKELGFRATHSPLEVQTELAFITELLWLIFSSDLKTALCTTEHDLLRNLLLLLAGSFDSKLSSEEARALSELMLFGKWQGADPQIIMQLIAQFIVASGKPLLLVVSNAHRISDSVASGLRYLLVALESMGWGQVRLIVEARDTKEDIGGSWENLERWMNSSLSSKIYRITLKPLDNETINKTIHKMLSSLDTDTSAELISGKCGGNPLYFKHLLFSLLEQDIIVSRWNNQLAKYDYILHRPAQLREYISSLSVRIEDILKRRISFWNIQLHNAGSESGAYLLGLLSVLGQEISRDIIQTLTREPYQILDMAFERLEEAGLLERYTDDVFIFPHEFAGFAARLWLDEQQNSRSWLLQILDHPVNLNDQNAYILSFCRGQLHSYLKQSVKAIEFYNAALQLADGNFESLFKCHQQIYSLQQEINSNETARIFHENVRLYLKHGYYILTVQQNRKINDQALASVKSVGTGILSFHERILYMQRYHHNLANLALQELNLMAYLNHAVATLELASTPVEVSKLLNRSLKACSYIGALKLGMYFGSVCISLAEKNEGDIDANLKSVNYGEYSFLISTIDSKEALSYANLAYEAAQTDRQKAHGLHSRVLAQLRLNNVSKAIEDVVELDEIIDRLSLKSFRSSQELIHGIVALLEERWMLAADSFRASLSEATWLGSLRKEVYSGTNLVVARVYSGDLKAAKVINESLLSLISKYKIISDIKILDPLTEKLNKWLARHTPDIPAEDTSNILNYEISQGPHILSPLLYNTIKLNQFWPDLFISSESFGIDPNQYGADNYNLNGTIKLSPKKNLPELYVIC